MSWLIAALTTIPAQVVREVDGFTKAMALTVDAESNIRDGQGTVKDYAQYFRGAESTEAQAQQEGLLSRSKGRDGWRIGKGAGDDAYALFLAGKLSADKAAAISRVAPGHARRSPDVFSLGLFGQ